MHFFSGYTIANNRSRRNIKRRTFVNCKLIKKNLEYILVLMTKILAFKSRTCIPTRRSNQLPIKRPAKKKTQVNVPKRLSAGTITLNDYIYHDTCVASKSTNYYRCSFYSKSAFRCPATLKVKTSGELLNGKKPHNHLPPSPINPVPGKYS